MYQITYVYSKTQIEFVEVWKYIDNKTNPPPKIEKWVLTYMSNYSGIVNIQYRKDIIIEAVDTFSLQCTDFTLNAEQSVNITAGATINVQSGSFINQQAGAPFNIQAPTVSVT